MSFQARYPGSCSNCGERFRPGAIVRYEDSVLVLDHECDQACGEDIGMKPENVCRRCFLVHNGECF